MSASESNPGRDLYGTVSERYRVLEEERQDAAVKEAWRRGLILGELIGAVCVGLLWWAFS